MSYWVKTIGGMVAILTGALTLLSFVNTAYLDYLDHHFATKEDALKIEHKIDTVIDSIDRIKEFEYGQRKH
jgi:hypothetical protein